MRVAEPRGDSGDRCVGFREHLRRALQARFPKIGANQSALGKMVDGWQITKGLGVYGTDYMKRAVVAAFGWPANLQEDAVYPYTLIDSTGAKLTGANKYTLTFAKGQTPPKIQKVN